jgi:hypothetical protein
VIVNKSRSAAMLLAGLLAARLMAADAPYTQEAQVMPTAAKEVQPATDRNERYQGSPAPEWIWGKDSNSPYRMTKEVAVENVKSAWLRASCDNSFNMQINGQKVGASREWNEPIEVDVTKYLKNGTNLLEAAVENQGGISGFICQLAVVTANGTKSFVVSNADWTANSKGDPNAKSEIKVNGKLGAQPWGDVFDKASDGNQSLFATLPGFQVELLYTVPKDELGSWVCLAVDPKGRLIVSDQGDKGLCRVTPAPLGSKEPTKVEKLDLKITSAQGMLFAFDSLYISVNGGPGSGLYRARDTNGDDQFDELQKLKEFLMLCGCLLMASMSWSFAATTLSPHSNLPNKPIIPSIAAAFRRTGVKTISCQGSGMQMDMREGFWLPVVGSLRRILKENLGKC